MGKVETPSLKAMTLSGGTTAAGEFSFGPKGGLPAVKHTVSGGITGLTWLSEILSEEAQLVYAAIELAEMPSDPLVDPLRLPVKVHLVNPVLGNNCYLGSNSNPIVLTMTTGTTNPPPPNPPIGGSEGSVAVTGPSGITDVTNGVRVDNVFSVPGAKGCVLTLFGFPPVAINGLINAQSELPSAAGRNAMTMSFDDEYVSAAIVYP